MEIMKLIMFNIAEWIVLCIVWGAIALLVWGFVLVLLTWRRGGHE